MSAQEIFLAGFHNTMTVDNKHYRKIFGRRTRQPEGGRYTVILGRRNDTEIVLDLFPGEPTIVNSVDTDTLAARLGVRVLKRAQRLAGGGRKIILSGTREIEPLGLFPEAKIE